MIVSPGPATLSMAAVGSAFGFIRGIPYLLGCAAGLIAVMIAAVVGLSQLVAHFPWATFSVSLIGFAYILYLAFKIATREPARAGLQDKDSPGFIAGVVVSLSNPKGWAVMGALFSSMGPVQNVVSPEIAIRIVILSVITLVGNFAWTLLGERLSQLLSNPAQIRTLNRIFAFLLVVSVLLALLL